MNAIESTKHYKDRIKAELHNTLTKTNLEAKTKSTGTVRDQYEFDDKIILITTDRQSAFDRVLASIPFKGQVLNLTSAWWFEQTKHIIKNQVIDIPDPNITIAKKFLDWEPKIQLREGLLKTIPFFEAFKNK